jgi:REP element-mobilizing transposase RayT
VFYPSDFNTTREKLVEGNSRCRSGITRGVDCKKQGHCVYHTRAIIWSRGYFVSTVGISESMISKYIKMQGKEDRGQAPLEF